MNFLNFCALIKTSALVSAVSGKVGGNVFARNSSGPYVRSWAKPVNPNTAKQQAVRASFATLISSWKNLTKAQQQLWADMPPQYPYVNRLGKTSTYTGQQLYNHLNMNLLVVGQSALSAPLVPQTFTSTGINAFDSVLTAGVLTQSDLTLDTAPSSTEATVVEITSSLSGGITKPAKGAFKQVVVLAGSAATVDIDLVAAYIALYGSPELATSIFARVYLINENTGQRLNIGQANAIVSGT